MTIEEQLKEAIGKMSPPTKKKVLSDQRHLLFDDSAASPDLVYPDSIDSIVY